MQQNQTVSEALQTLEAKGYHLADALGDQPDESIQSSDWRLDSVQKVQEDGRNALLIAVSSASRRLKLVFVESTFYKARQVATMVQVPVREQHYINFTAPDWQLIPIHQAQLFHSLEQSTINQNIFSGNSN